MARELGFDDINMDIIIGLPGEGHEELIKTRDELIKLNPDSITVHGLCLKRGSRMYENFYNIEMIEEKQTVIALGADAVSKIIFLDEDRIERFANLKDIREYVSRVDEMIDKKIKLLNTLY
ncbi:Oxygen-independent coproporphyrinogen-III oxidase 2 [Clostridioides difficile]|nr:Oxygen-independent coproporphyrinogen-III oxidase 2 [Clostridioides difficile]